MLDFLVNGLPPEFNIVTYQYDGGTLTVPPDRVDSCIRDIDSYMLEHHAHMSFEFELVRPNLG